MEILRAHRALLVWGTCCRVHSSPDLHSIQGQNITPCPSEVSPKPLKTSLLREGPSNCFIITMAADLIERGAATVVSLPKNLLNWKRSNFVYSPFLQPSSEKYSVVNNSNSQAEKSQSVLSNPATTTGIQQILMDLLTASQNLHCQELKTPLPNWAGRLYPADWLLESLLWLREPECKHSYKSHLNNCCNGKRERAQLPRVSRALSVGTVHLSQVPNQLSWLLQKTLHRVPERGRGKKNWREKRPWTQNRLFWNQAEYLAWINPRIQCSDLTWICVKEVRNICKWAHWINNLSLYFSGPPCPDAHLQQDFMNNCTCTLLFADSCWMDMVTRGVTLIPWSPLSHFHIGFAIATTKKFNWSPEKKTGISSSPMWQSIQAIQSPPSA